MGPIAFALWWVLNVYVWVLLARIILSWLPMVAPSWQPKGIVLVLLELIYTLTDPPMKALSRVLPPVRLGNVSLDLSVLVLLVLIQLLQTAVRFLPF